jgi:hypothetical protein
MNNINSYLYVSPEISLDVTSATAGYAKNRAVAVFYLTSNNVWRMKGNINASLTNGTTITVTIMGIVFASVNQAVTAYGSAGGCNAYATANNLTIVCTMTATTAVALSFDLELASKPSYYIGDDI